MKRSKKGSQIVGSGRRGQGSPRSEQASAATRKDKHRWVFGSRGGRIAAGGAVLLVPVLVAIYLHWSLTPDVSVPKASRILSSLDSTKESDHPDERSVPQDSPAAGTNERTKHIPVVFRRGSRASLGRIAIPTIGLKTRYFEGVYDRAVELGPGHWPGTPWPGAPGNAVFAGHRTTYTHPFEDLDLLSSGDLVRAGVRNTKPTRYRVVSTTVVPEEEYADFVLKQPLNKQARIITLFACTPKGSRSHRIVVRAKAPEAARRGLSMN